MKTIKSIVILLLIAIVNPLEAQTVTTTLDATVRDISELNIGFNRRSDNGTWYTDNSFINLVSEMNPDVVRYPGGTQANYWDWSTGQFLENTDKNWGNKEIVIIPTFLNVLPPNETDTLASFLLAKEQFVLSAVGLLDAHSPAISIQRNDQFLTFLFNSPSEALTAGLLLLASASHMVHIGVGHGSGYMLDYFQSIRIQ